MKGAEPRNEIDSSDGSSREEEGGEELTSSSENHQHPSREDDAAVECAGMEGDESAEQDLYVHIPESVKHVLEEDYFHIKHHNKVR